MNYGGEFDLYSKVVLMFLSGMVLNERIKKTLVTAAEIHLCLAESCTVLMQRCQNSDLKVKYS